MRWRPWRAAGLGLALPGLLAAQTRDSAYRYARITYLTVSTAYLAAGRDDGLRDSMRLDVFRSGKRVGALRVSFLASHQAAAEILDTAVALAVGDSARYVPPAAAPSAAAPTAATQRPAPKRYASSLYGTVGAEYFSVTGNGVRLTQPGIDLRVFGGPEGSPLSVGLDLRERRVTTAAAGTPTAGVDESRIYQAVVRWQTPGSPLRVGLGRQFVDGMAAVGLIDGLQVERAGPAWSAGAFVGTQPGVADLEVSGDIRELGAYVRRQGHPAAGGFWSLTAGASGSYEGWRTNREFLYLEARYFGPRLSGFLSQEVDYYRPWKRVAGEPAFSPTATFGDVRYQMSGAWSVQGGVDERRNVRLFQDAISPESTFDAAFRRGAWLGTTIRPGRHLLVDLDARASDGGSIGRTDSYTGAFAFDRLGTLGGAVRVRGTRYLSPGRAGWLGAAEVGVSPADRWRLSVNAGERRESVDLPPETPVTRWAGMEVDLSLGRTWFGTLSFTRQRGAQQDADQLFLLFTYRF